ncbi:uncharacterized protein LOC131953594 [Physella acuta]|uniref:uncharacterized protein LOC131953594 n=1 Tax=Physella acuta TaxID=109671 RepID=UPI0027DE1CAF|nr:uncharacterized protein LOC131953594 [Physella acuta]XP_059172819.1 uncharacterized protein LOC131953594 [Physella acuta]XP_059172820.1 uncharacterized protein LOC131953594 [Physella acuta]
MAYRKENEELLAKLTPGDIVKFKRSSLWSDFAIYVGNGKVVHLKGSSNSEEPEYPINVLYAVPPFHNTLCLIRLKYRKKLERETLPSQGFYDHTKYYRPEVIMEMPSTGMPGGYRPDSRN